MAPKILFTESQWEELENQALVFKYLVSGVSVPPHLLFLIHRPFPFSSSSSLYPHLRWNVYEMGMGRKIDSEPGRCRRTDGKKWRCSKEAYPDSKYCERHMHRGKNRSSTKSLDSSLSSSRVRRSGYIEDFFSKEPLGSIKSSSSSAMEDDDGSCRYESIKQKPDRHCFILGTDMGTRERPLILEEKMKQRGDKEFDEEEEQRSKRVHRFLDEWPSSKSSVSTSLFI